MPMHFNQIKETCLYVQDLQKTQDFYAGKLNLEVLGKVEGRHIFFKAGTSVLLCFLADATKEDEKLPAHYGSGRMHMAFEVPKERYPKFRDWIRARHIEIEHEHRWSNEYSSFYFRDPDGHSLEIVPEGLWD